jgi:elongation factor G
MLERLADYDDALWRNLISEIEPPKDPDLRGPRPGAAERHVVPAFIGAAERSHGITRLLKALRHEAPRLPETRARLGLSRCPSAARAGR